MRKQVRMLFSDSLVAADEIFPWQNLIYYSYATLTTLGYGDILPVTLWARSFGQYRSNYWRVVHHDYYGAFGWFVCGDRNGNICRKE